MTILNRIVKYKQRERERARERERERRRDDSFRGQSSSTPKPKKNKISHVGLVDLPGHHPPDARPADAGPARVRQLQPGLESGVQNVLGLFALDRDLLPSEPDKRDAALAAVVDRLFARGGDDVPAELVREHSEGAGVSSSLLEPARRRSGGALTVRSRSWSACRG